MIEDKESLQIQAIIYNIEPSDIDKNNISVTVIMGCYRIVFLNMFVDSLMVSFTMIVDTINCIKCIKCAEIYLMFFQSFLNNFQAAQQAIKDASAAAAEAAKTNIKDVKESATRIGLAVKIKVFLWLIKFYIFLEYLSLSKTFCLRLLSYMCRCIRKVIIA